MVSTPRSNNKKFEFEYKNNKLKCLLKNELNSLEKFNNKHPLYKNKNYYLLKKCAENKIDLDLIRSDFIHWHNVYLRREKLIALLRAKKMPDEWNYALNKSKAYLFDKLKRVSVKAEIIQDPIKDSYVDATNKLIALLEKIPSSVNNTQRKNVENFEYFFPDNIINSFYLLNQQAHNINEIINAAQQKILLEKLAKFEILSRLKHLMNNRFVRLENEKDILDYSSCIMKLNNMPLRFAKKVTEYHDFWIKKWGIMRPFEPKIIKEKLIQCQSIDNKIE